MTGRWRPRRFGKTAGALAEAAVAADKEMAEGHEPSVIVACRKRIESKVRDRLDALGAFSVKVHAYHGDE